MKRLCMTCCALICLLLGCSDSESVTIKIKTDKKRMAEIECCSNLKQIGTALWMYLCDNGRFPTSSDMNNDAFLKKLSEYEGPLIFKCNEKASENYRFFLNGESEDIDKNNPSETIIAICDKHKNNVNVLFADGHVQTVDKNAVNAAIENAQTGKMPVLKE